MGNAPLMKSKTEQLHLVYLFKKSNKDKQLRQLLLQMFALFRIIAY